MRYITTTTSGGKTYIYDTKKDKMVDKNKKHEVAKKMKGSWKEAARVNKATFMGEYKRFKKELSK
jgi:hypothetical protein